MNDAAERFDEIVNRADVLLAKAQVPSEVRESFRSMIVELGECNFACYWANMAAIKARQEGDDDVAWKVAECELAARTVGEQRVRLKASINTTLARAYGERPRTAIAGDWITDDVVFSVGEMFDRLTIEHIKQDHFSGANNHGSVSASRELSARVWRVLELKLQEIERKRWYEALPETRTYA